MPDIIYYSTRTKFLKMQSLQNKVVIITQLTMLCLDSILVQEKFSDMEK